MGTIKEFSAYFSIMVCEDGYNWVEKFSMKIYGKGLMYVYNFGKICDTSIKKLKKISKILKITLYIY